MDLKFRLRRVQLFRSVNMRIHVDFFMSLSDVHDSGGRSESTFNDIKSELPEPEHKLTGL